MRITIELDGRPPTANAERRGSGSHWAKRAASTSSWRERAQLRGIEARRAMRIAPHAHTIEVTAQQLSKDRRWLQDIGACAPAVKACIDGLVDARIVANDTPEHLTRLSYIGPDICGRDGLRLIIDLTPIEAAA